jgi:hypothetical protein
MRAIPGQVPTHPRSWSTSIDPYPWACSFAPADKFAVKFDRGSHPESNGCPKRDVTTELWPPGSIRTHLKPRGRNDANSAVARSRRRAVARHRALPVPARRICRQGD